MSAAAPARAAGLDAAAAPAHAGAAPGATAKESFFAYVKSNIDMKNYSHTFTCDVLTELVSALHGWDDKSAHDRSAADKAHGGNKKLYKMAKKYGVVELPAEDGGKDLVLCERNQDGSMPSFDKMRVIVPVEQWYEKIRECHLQGGHAKSRTLEKRVNDKYARIPRWALTVCFLLCKLCCFFCSKHFCCFLIVACRYCVGRVFVTAVKYASQHNRGRSTPQAISLFSPRDLAPGAKLILSTSSPCPMVIISIF